MDKKYTEEDIIQFFEHFKKVPNPIDMETIYQVLNQKQIVDSPIKKAPRLFNYFITFGIVFSTLILFIYLAKKSVDVGNHYTVESEKNYDKSIFYTEPIISSAQDSIFNESPKESDSKKSGIELKLTQFGLKPLNNQISQLNPMSFKKDSIVVIKTPYFSNNIDSAVNENVEVGLIPDTTDTSIETNYESNKVTNNINNLTPIEDPNHNCNLLDQDKRNSYQGKLKKVCRIVGKVSGCPDGKLIIGYRRVGDLKFKKRFIRVKEGKFSTKIRTDGLTHVRILIPQINQKLITQNSIGIIDSRIDLFLNRGDSLEIKANISKELKVSYSVSGNELNDRLEEYRGYMWSFWQNYPHLIKNTIDYDREIMPQLDEVLHKEEQIVKNDSRLGSCVTYYSYGFW